LIMLVRNKLLRPYSLVWLSCLQGNRTQTIRDSVSRSGLLFFLLNYFSHMYCCWSSACIFLKSAYLMRWACSYGSAKSTYITICTFPN
jgi:hypothetical protein